MGRTNQTQVTMKTKKSSERGASWRRNTMDRAGGETEDHTLAGERAKREPMPVADCDYEPDDRSWKGIPCMVCKTQLNSPRQYEQHLSGKYHAEREKQKSEGKNAWITLTVWCTATMTSVLPAGRSNSERGASPRPLRTHKRGRGKRPTTQPCCGTSRAQPPLLRVALRLPQAWGVVRGASPRPRPRTQMGA